ncbi:SAM-dependent DNA methyltransferase [Vibrio cholerae]|nr:SAM-dependent DNA methyltransferase [Vibrio cholerae]
MRQALDKTLRKKLEDTVVKARDIVEQAVFEALQRLGVAEAQAPSYLNEEERALRNKLRAHARQLGDKLKDGKQETERLINEMAYEHWHRMLFARYLEQNNLLMYDEYTPVTLDECFELAEEEPNCKDGWELAGRLAQKMLPQIFRVDSPVFDIKLSMNRVEELESLIAQLDPKTYQAQDSLGWCYQFWQTKKKDQVNKSGVKIGAQELSPVTQLFTEPYMVSFLLDNALGAWWANKRLSQDDLIRANNEQELRELAAIPGVPLEYLRFSKEEEATQWKPAAGGFEKWPEHLSELKTLDPCCGSGHFLVAVFLMLVPMRMQLEGLSEKQAVDAVLRDNIYGLELDQRCVELAAFALALEAWRYPNAGGYRVLPELQLACSGMSIAEAQKDWKDLAKGDEVLTEAITWMENTFKDAPTLGSLITPNRSLYEENNAPWKLLQNGLLDNSQISSKSKLAGYELIKLSTILASQFSWVITNVPYLGRGKMDDKLGEYVDSFYPLSSSDLATSLIDRAFEMSNGCVSIVSSQNWMFLGTFEKFRKSFLKKSCISMLARLGYKSFSTPMYDFPVVLFSTVMQPASERHSYLSCDAEAVDKENLLADGILSSYNQYDHLDSPKSRISFGLQNSDSLLPVKSTEGLSTGDSARYLREFWEVDSLGKDYILYQTSPSKPAAYDGMRKIMFWQSGEGSLSKSSAARIQGLSAWGKPGILVGRVGDIRGTKYFGGAFDKSAVVLSAKEPNVDMDEVYRFVISDEFEKQVRSIDKKLGVATSVFESIPFVPALEELEGVNSTNDETLDETQWLYAGGILCANNELQVAVARLLGYQWPAELDPEMELAPEMREVMKKNADFAGLIDDDGIVCIPAVRGEKTAAKRLEAILHKAYGDEWTSSVEQNLLKAVKAKDLESWLRDKFFDQHCKLFQHRPFIWQVWDGLKDGFSALVNYHKLDYKGLERLIYTYLDDWISTQKRDVADGKDGADIRLTAAENLKKQLEAILAGEKGLDIFVRWKPLEEQPIGWNPDLNDGVRLNIRPFMLAKDVGKKGAGVLRGKPNINWNKDRGTDVASAPWFALGPVYGEKEGSRINDHHLTLAEKKAAREQADD